MKLSELHVGDKFMFDGCEFIVVKHNQVNTNIKKVDALDGPTYKLNAIATVKKTTSANETGYADISKASHTPLPELNAGTIVRLNSSAIKSAKFSPLTTYVILKVNSVKYSMTEVNGTGIAIVSAPFNAVHKVDVKF